jgi:hypothetical protein
MVWELEGPTPIL